MSGQWRTTQPGALELRMAQDDYRKGNSAGAAGPFGFAPSPSSQQQHRQSPAGTPTRPTSSSRGGVGPSSPFQRGHSASSQIYRAASSRIGTQRNAFYPSSSEPVRPTTAQASSQQQLTAYQITRPPTSGGLGIGTQEYSPFTRYSPVQAYGKAGSPSSARGGRAPSARPATAASLDFSGSPAARAAWHDSGGASGPHSPGAYGNSSGRGGPTYPPEMHNVYTMQPMNSPSRPTSSTYRMMSRSHSARQEQHNSLLASLMVQQVGTGDYSIGHTGLRTLTYSPGSTSAKTRKSGRLTRPSGSASTSPHKPYSARPGTGTPGRGGPGGAGRHAAGAAGAVFQYDQPLQRRFSTGSVAGNQQWADVAGGAGGDGGTGGAWTALAHPNAPRMQEGTLTCVRPSTANVSNFALAFAAESQQDVPSATQGPYRSSGSQHTMGNTGSPPGASEPVSPGQWASRPGEWQPVPANTRYPPSQSPSHHSTPQSQQQHAGRTGHNAGYPISPTRSVKAHTVTHAIPAHGSHDSAASSSHTHVPAEAAAMSSDGAGSSHVLPHTHTHDSTHGAGSGSGDNNTWSSQHHASSAADSVHQPSESGPEHPTTTSTHSHHQQQHSQDSHSSSHEDKHRQSRPAAARPAAPQSPAAAPRRSSLEQARRAPQPAAAAWGAADAARPATPVSASKQHTHSDAANGASTQQQQEQQPQQQHRQPQAAWVQPATAAATQHADPVVSAPPDTHAPRAPTPPAGAAPRPHGGAAAPPHSRAVGAERATTPAKAPTTAHHALDTRGGTSDQRSATEKAAEASTNPLHMFVGLASRRVTILPPRLPNAVDEQTLLSGHVNAEHTAALPGYTVGKVIGEGGFCQVRLAVHKLSGRRVAVKVIDKAKLADAGEARRIQREIRVMRHLSHECVVKLFEVVDAPTLLYLVMEHAPCGSLLDYVRGRKRLTETDAVTVVQQIVAGLSYCHQREVVHRDIKLENILMDANNCMKLIDFGLSAFFIPGKQLKVHCGSPSYAAPEIVARKYYDGPPVDVWSLGVVLFAMLAGHLPFHASGGNKQELCAKIMEGRYTCPEYLSAHAKDLLSRMLCVDPTKRITLDQVSAHPWLATAGSRWDPLGASVYMVRVDAQAGLVYADEQLVMELEAAGYPRQTILQYLLSGEANYLTAAYFLMTEGKAEVIRRMRGVAAARRYIARGAAPTPGSAAAAESHVGMPLTPTSHGAAAGALTAAPPKHEPVLTQFHTSSIVTHTHDKSHTSKGGPHDHGSDRTHAHAMRIPAAAT